MIKFNNSVIEEFNNDAKDELYKALDNNEEIYYTSNQRAVPVMNDKGNYNVFEAQGLKVVINPSDKQKDYFKQKVFRWTELDRLIYKKGLKDKIKLDDDRQIKALSKMLDNQYQMEDVRDMTKVAIKF